MIKYLILLFNLMGLFLYQLFFQTNVTATQSVPSSANAGSSFVVEVTINKSDVAGFAKYQEDLPKGFTATAVEKSGATILSSDNAIKFIWASLPSEATVKISFRVTVDASVSGAQSLAGKFLYVVNNERQEADVAASSITINGTTPAVANNTNTSATTPTTDTSHPSTTPTTVTPADNNTNTATTQTVTPTNNNTTTATTQTVTPADNSTNTNTTTATANNTTSATNTATPTVVGAPAVTHANASRSLSAASVAPASDITVSITVHKGNIGGFAKVEETLPAGVIASEGDKMGASFTFVDNTVKFVWLNLPADSVFTVTYKLTPSSTVSGNQSVSGEFSYLQNDNAEKFVIPASTFTVQNASQPITNNTQATNPPVTNISTVTAVDTTHPTTVTTSTTTSVTADTSHKVTTQVTQTTQPANNPPVTNNPPDMTNAVTPHVSSSGGGVMYRVQIMALHNPVKASYLSNKYKITEKISEEMLEGYTKYTVGRFNEYKSSRDHREEIKNKGVEGPFVVAFNDGKRITVQEALMITHQQWYK